MAAVVKAEAPTTGAAVVAAGLALRGIPYAGGTLDHSLSERIVCNFRALDCVTFVEICLAVARLSRSAHSGSGDFKDFAREIARLRYRQEVPNGYGSRLHYFSDWLGVNERRGILRNITLELGGQAALRPISFMSSHPESYPRLADPPTYDAIVAAEVALSQRPFVMVRLEAIAALEPRLADGDILAFVPKTKGLDVSHLGFAYRQKDGKPHLLHAALSGAVQVSQESIVGYMRRFRKLEGVIVARPL